MLATAFWGALNLLNLKMTDHENTMTAKWNTWKNEEQNPKVNFAITEKN